MITIYNRSFLKETRKVYRQFNYQFSGYTFNRQVKTKKIQKKTNS